MSILPYIEPIEQSVEMIQQFGGYNHRISISDNEFYDMKNMSSKDFPLASVRDKRGLLKVGDKGFVDTAQGIVAKNKLIIPTIERGEIGVTVAETVEAQPEVSIANASEINGGWHTEIEGDPKTHSTRAKINRAYLQDKDMRSLTNCEFSLDTDDDNKWEWLRLTGARTVNIYADRDPTMLFLPFPHDEVPPGRAWMPVVFATDEVLRPSEEIDESGQFTLRCYAYDIDNDRLFEELVREQTTLHFAPSSSSGLYKWKAKIVEYSPTYIHRDRNKRDITFQVVGERWDSSSWISVNAVFRFMAGGLDSITDSPIEARKISDYIYSKVKVNAEYANNVRALTGQTIYMANQWLEVANVLTDEDEKYIYVVRPHGEIPKGSTAEGDRLYLSEVDIDSGEAITSNICAAQEGRRMLIEKGGELCIFPEKVIVNTLNKSESGQFADVQQMELSNILKGDYSYQLCDISGKTYTSGAVQSTSPSSPPNGYAWIDTSKTPPTLKVWSSQTSQWAVTQAYCQITSTVMSDEWSVGDAVSIEFSEGAGKYIVPMKDQKYYVISEVGEKDGKRFIRFPASMSTVGKVDATVESDVITITRTVPDMDFVIECKNRLWGCKYGLDEDGNMINEIFASKQGDAKNWHHFTNTAIDSYYVSMGDDGEFTGACTYKNNPMFFREDCFHTIFGDYPAAYGLQTIHGHGLEKGSDNGVTVMNGVVFYKSPVGIMAYTGANPVNITENFGYEKYKNAIATSLGSKMYFNLEEKNGKRVTFAFDDNTKMWHKEDELDVKDFAVHEGEIYALTNDGSVLTMLGSKGTLEGDVDWMLESGNIGYNTPFRKRIGRLNLRLKMELGAKASIFIQYDSDGNWNHICNLSPSGKVKSMTTPIIPHRCDHFALKIEGKGDCKILSITKFMEDGSDAD